MTLQLKINRKPKLVAPVMLCDQPLSSKLDRYDLTSFMNNHSTTLFCGSPGSGKTSLINSMFSNPFKKVFHKVYIFQPSHSRASIKKNIFGNLPKDRFYDELTAENLLEVMDKIRGLEDENSVIIFDDQSAYLKDAGVLKLFKELIFNRRHLRTSVFFLNQTYRSTPKEIRRLFNNIFLFKTSKDIMKDLFEEVVEDKEKINLIPQLSKLVYNKPYQYLFINTPSQRFFKGFDEILF